MKEVKTNEMVSIIIPVYKVPEKYLRKCIYSCIKQTYKYLEIVIVHDCSDDNCGNICDEYAKKYDFITVLHKNEKTNGGLSAARNDGVKASKGKWITFLDGDDWIEPYTVECMVKAAIENGITQIVISKVCKDYGGNVEPYNYEYKNGQCFDKTGCKYLQKEVLNFKANISGAYAKLINREYLIEHNIFHDESLKHGVEGLEFNIRMFDKADSAIFIDKICYHYMYNDQSLSVNVSESTNQYAISGFNKIKNFIAEKQNNSEMLELLNNRILYFIITTALRSYFSPKSSLNYREKIKKFNIFLQEKIIKETLNENVYKNLSFSRKITLFFIKHRLYFFIQQIANIRYKQLQTKKKGN